MSARFFGNVVVIEVAGAGPKLLIGNLGTFTPVFGAFLASLAHVPHAPLLRMDGRAMTDGRIRSMLAPSEAAF